MERHKKNGSPLRALERLALCLGSPLSSQLSGLSRVSAALSGLSRHSGALSGLSRQLSQGCLGSALRAVSAALSGLPRQLSQGFLGSSQLSQLSGLSRQLPQGCLGSSLRAISAAPSGLSRQLPEILNPGVYTHMPQGAPACWLPAAAICAAVEEPRIKLELERHGEDKGQLFRWLHF
jgi:hypothetical protein